MELQFPDRVDPRGRRDLERSFDNHNLDVILLRCLLDMDKIGVIDIHSKVGIKCT